MNDALAGGILAGWARHVFGMPTFRVHETDCPEIEAEGQTPAEACACLVQLLIQAIDFASEPGRRSPSGWPWSRPALGAGA